VRGRPEAAVRRPAPQVGGSFPTLPERTSYLS